MVAMASESLCDEHFSSTSRSNSGAEDKKDQFGVFRSRNGRASPTHSAHGCLMRTSLQKLSQEKRAKKVRFYRNGDKFHKGLIYALSQEKIRTFEALLEDLTRVLVDQVNLPKGVRHIFSIDGKEKIGSLDQLQEGEAYVCSSTDHFVKLDYIKNERPQWSVTRKHEENLLLKYDPLLENGTKATRNFIKPKLVTIIRNGIKPRKAVRILLNKKTAHSFDQVMNDITSAIKLDTGAVRKVFTLSGKQVTCLADFFGEEDIFIAYGPEKYSHDDFDLDSEECKYLTGSSRTILSKKFRSSASAHSPTPRRRASSPVFPADMSPYNSGRSSLSSSPKFARKSQAKSPNSKPKLQNGHSISPPCLPNEITDRYTVGKVIGDGNFAIVHECVEKATKQEYALKIIDKNKCRGKEHMIASEVAILRKVKHPNIVQLMEEFDLHNELYLVMELIKGGDLFDAIASATKYSERDASGMIYNLSSALGYLHSMNIVHRDIKPENLLVVEHEDGSKSLKLGDFGLAVESEDLLYTICGTPTYVAPEILSETGYGFKVDIWAAGVITYILLCGFPPFVSQSNDQDELFDQILAGKYEFTSPFWDDISGSAKKNRKPSEKTTEKTTQTMFCLLHYDLDHTHKRRNPKNSFANFWELISCMLQVDPNKRYSAAQILEHPWVAADAALDNDMQSTVSTKLSMHFDHKPKSSVKSAGIALIAVSS